MGMHFLVGQCHALKLTSDELRNDIGTRILTSRSNNRRDHFRKFISCPARRLWIARFGKDCQCPLALSVLEPFGQSKFSTNRPERKSVSEFSYEVTLTLSNKTIDQFMGERCEFLIDESDSSA
ncbi:unannotated protein [freshwater metagenome]|uniref:Unannotated protein n=1 Tax=freshwater metagenome TaxID=449393 RepID=A0A6J6AKA3_9ZZZZ